MLRNRYFVSLVVILLVAVVIYNLSFFSRRLRPLNSMRSTIPVSKTEDTVRVNKSPFPVAKDESRWLRDPFLHEEEGSKEKKFPLNDKRDFNVKIVLQGIMIAKGKSYALVNGWVVKKGDRIEGMVVEDVSRDGILLKTEDKLEKIKLE